MDQEIFVTPWSNVSSRGYDSWHSMCSYLGSFPAPLASYFIHSFSNEGDLVYDPFSGRGTTLLEARLLNRQALATDLNPIALALTEAKNENLALSEIIERIEELARRYDAALFLPEALAQPEAIHLIFHPRTLAQLCYLKRKFAKSTTSIDKFLLGACLGIMHGGERKDGSSGYASISMPNTFSMAPDYVRRFVQTKELRREFRDVFQLLKDKSERLYEKHEILGQSGAVFSADAKRLSEYPFLAEFGNRVKLVLTSPPYLGIVNYARQNWIRSWLLDGEPEEVSKFLDDGLSLNEWIAFARKVITQIKHFLREDGTAVFVIGDVATSKTSVIPLAREFCFMVMEMGLFKNIWCITDVILDSDKTTRIWGETKGGATKKDRVVILSDVNPFTEETEDGMFQNLDFESVVASTKQFLGR